MLSGRAQRRTGRVAVVVTLTYVWSECSCWCSLFCCPSLVCAPWARLHHRRGSDPAWRVGAGWPVSRPPSAPPLSPVLMPPAPAGHPVLDTPGGADPPDYVPQSQPGPQSRPGPPRLLFEGKLFTNHHITSKRPAPSCQKDAKNVCCYFPSLITAFQTETKIKWEKQKGLGSVRCPCLLPSLCHEHFYTRAWSHPARPPLLFLTPSCTRRSSFHNMRLAVLLLSGCVDRL